MTQIDRKKLVEVTLPTEIIKAASAESRLCPAAMPDVR